MLKRILLLLDDTPASLVARRYATDLAKAMDAEVAGFAGVDLVSIETPMAGGVGTSAYKFQLEEQLKKQAEDIRNQQHDTYEQECKAQGLTFEWFAFEGDPVGSLNLAAETCDLIITGHDTGFQGNAHERFAEALAKMLMMTPRPMLVCGDELSAAQSVLVAYDGSLPAMRALQMFTLLGLGRGQTYSPYLDRRRQGVRGAPDKRGMPLSAQPRLRGRSEFDRDTRGSGRSPAYRSR